MSQDDAAIQRAQALLSSSDLNENKNGAALVINSAANAHSIPKLLRANVVGLLLPKLNSNDEDLVMKAAWAVNNLCVHDEGRNACQAAGVLQYFGKVLQNPSSEVVKKACWALTNLARNPEAQKEIVRGQVFNSLINVLTYGKNDEEKGFALQPLCNLVLDANNQLAFKNANGLAATVRLMSSTFPKTQELAVTLISFVTTNHDSIREDLIDQGVLAPLCVLLNGAKTGKLQEYALNSLVNLSLSEVAEKAILNQGAVRPVVGLLSSEDPKLQQQAAMLLSNLLTNAEIRASVRYFAWVDPVLKLVRTGDAQTLQQILRVIINIAFDEHCRYMLQKADATSIINNATSQSSDNNVFNLSSTAIKNLSVPVPSTVQNEVNQKLSSGGVEHISAPKAAEQAKTSFDMKGLDDVLGGYGASSQNKKPAPAAAPASKPAAKPMSDDLDDLLSDFNPAPKKPEPKPAYSAPPPAAASKAPPPSRNNNNYDLDLDDLLNDVQPKSQPKPAAVSQPPKHAAKNRNDLDDIDDLLSGIDSAPKKGPPPKKAAQDDIDDLLADIEPHKPSHSNKAPASKPKSDLDDIDDLLADMTPSRGGGGGSRPSRPPQQNDDIDDLLSGIGGGSYGGSRQSYGGGDDIDDLLSDLSAPPRASNRPPARGTASGLDAIDDLLADLTG